jgi:hypothetical protein
MGFLVRKVSWKEGRQKKALGGMHFHFYLNIGVGEGELDVRVISLSVPPMGVWNTRIYRSRLRAACLRPSLLVGFYYHLSDLVFFFLQALGEQECSRKQGEKTTHTGGRAFASRCQFWVVFGVAFLKTPPFRKG